MCVSFGNILHAKIYIVNFYLNFYLHSLLTQCHDVITPNICNLYRHCEYYTFEQLRSRVHRPVCFVSRASASPRVTGTLHAFVLYNTRVLLCCGLFFYVRPIKRSFPCSTAATRRLPSLLLAVLLLRSTSKYLLSFLTRIYIFLYVD